MSDILSNYDPYLVSLARQLEPGEWWDSGAVGYVASMFDSRSFEERVAAAIRNADRLVHFIAATLNEPLPAPLENSIGELVRKAAEPLRVQNGQLLAELEEARNELSDLRAYAALHQDEPEPTNAEGFIDLEDTLIDDSNPLLQDMVRAAPLPPMKKDVDLVDVGPSVTPGVTPALKKMNEEFLSTQMPNSGHLKILSEALRRAQYTAEPLDFQIETRVSIFPAGSQEDLLATIDVTTEGDIVTARRVWLTKDKPTDKHAQIYQIIESSGKDVGEHLVALVK